MARPKKAAGEKYIRQDISMEPKLKDLWRNVSSRIGLYLGLLERHWTTILCVTLHINTDI